jgi:hypothetical protein
MFYQTSGLLEFMQYYRHPLASTCGNSEMLDIGLFPKERLNMSCTYHVSYLSRGHPCRH